MALFNLSLQGDTLHVGFGDPGQNDAIVKEVATSLKAMKLPGGPLIKINGPASLPVAFVLAHAVLHMYDAVAVWDPKLPNPGAEKPGRYVVVSSHSGTVPFGSLID